MPLNVELVSESARPSLQRLLELNVYEFSATDGRDIGPNTEYGYRCLGHYWRESSDRPRSTTASDARPCEPGQPDQHGPEGEAFEGT